MDPGVESAATELVDLVEDSWNRAGRPAYLATVGGRLSNAAKAALRTTRLPLRTFVSTHLADKLRQVHAGEGRDLVAPASATYGLSDSEFSSLVSPGATRSRRFPRFLADVWRAFSRPMESTRRFLRLDNGSAELLALGSDDPTPSDAFEVTQADLPAVDPELGYPKATDIAEAISAWASKHGIELPALHEEKRLDPAESGSAKLFRRTIGDGDGIQRLTRFLEFLEPHEQEKVTIPGDVLLSILRKSR